MALARVFVGSRAPSKRHGFPAPRNDRNNSNAVPSVNTPIAFRGRRKAVRSGLANELPGKPYPLGRRPPRQNQEWPLAGMEGILLRRKAAFRVVLSVDPSCDP